MNKIAVINASPLIILCRGNHLELLRVFADKVLVPNPVADEIMMRGPDDATASQINGSSWIETVPAPFINEGIIEWGLGAGESSVIAYARKHPGMEAIIDDLAGRRCAASLEIPVRGTLGIVLVAKKRDVIPAARPVMESLIRSGLYLSKSVLDEALKRVGE